MSLVRNIKNMQRIRSANTSIWFGRLMSSSTPVPTNPPPGDTPKPPSNTNSIPGVPSSRASYKPDNLEKRFLVWTGKYKSIEEVPEYVYQETMERTRNRIRIKGANIMMALTVLGCIAMAYSGKKAAESGESVEKYNLDWHKTYNEANAKPTS